tara:strand:- start:153 stop:431 length:279 start_codon:yes stop_codon:yes gene_type:complete
MNIQKIYHLIIDEPIYLTIAIILALIISYSLLKKLFKILIITLLVLLCYVGYLMCTGKELPNEDQISSVKEKVENVGEKIFDKLDKMSQTNN